MNYTLTEKEALKKLDANSFREISKDKILDFMSILPDMKPEVAMKALEQFPNFATCSAKALAEMKESYLKTVESEGKALDQVMQSRLVVIESLSKLLEEDDLTFEEKMLVAEKMTELTDKNSQDYGQHQNFLIEGLKTIAVPCLAIILVGASLLGFKGRFKS